MTIKLEKINKDNWKDAIHLKTSEDHKHFVASNLYSIAEAQFNPGMYVYGIYNDKLMVGFAMYGVCEDFGGDEHDNRFWIWRMMIAEDHRGKGYGRAALKLIIKDAINMKQEAVVLSTVPKNKKGIALYESIGFKATGIIEDGEEEYILTLNSEN